MKIIPKKSLGQNFLTDINIINKIIDVARINEKDNILEVGPGTGNLTKEIIKKKPKKIFLIEKDKLLPIIEQIDKSFKIKSFFNISAKYNLGINNLLDYLKKFSKESKWLFLEDQISNKDDIFITNECTRNAILTYLHKELPYNISIINQYYKHLKNGDLKIKQKLIINNLRYRKIILGKKGEKIKMIREFSQNQISKILNCKTHLYLEVIRDNAN